MDQKLKIVFFLTLACAIVLSLAGHFIAVFPFDPNITHELQEVKNPGFALVMQVVSTLGDTRVGIVLIGAGTLLFLFKRKWIESVLILATLSNFALTSVLKVLIARPRPPYFVMNPADTFQFIDKYSFPSGHVLFFVVFFGCIAYLAWLHQTGRIRIIVIAICSALILLIGPSRVYLGEHWASDVLGSYVIGVLWLFLLILGYQQMLRTRDARSEET